MFQQFHTYAAPAQKRRSNGDSRSSEAAVSREATSGSLGPTYWNRILTEVSS
jgi:hypothetical protein